MFELLSCDGGCWVAHMQRIRRLGPRHVAAETVNVGAALCAGHAKRTAIVRPCACTSAKYGKGSEGWMGGGQQLSLQRRGMWVQQDPSTHSGCTDERYSWMSVSVIGNGKWLCTCTETNFADETSALEQNTCGGFNKPKPVDAPTHGPKARTRAPTHPPTAPLAHK
jgi:hypothetical protein